MCFTIIIITLFIRCPVKGKSRKTQPTYRSPPAYLHAIDNIHQEESGGATSILPPRLRRRGRLTSLPPPSLFTLARLA